jgi:hypothetical protein
LTHAASGRYTPAVPSPKRVSSAVYAVFVTLAGAFVVSSTYQIAVGVFEQPAPPSAGGQSGQTARVTPACAEGVRTLVVAVDRGVSAAAGASDPVEAENRYRAARSPEWDEARQKELVQPCSSDPRGLDAVAAASRFDRAAAGAIRHQTDELGPVRRAVDSFIR